VQQQGPEQGDTTSHQESNNETRQDQKPHIAEQKTTIDSIGENIKTGIKQQQEQNEENNKHKRNIKQDKTQLNTNTGNRNQNDEPKTQRHETGNTGTRTTNNECQSQTRNTINVEQEEYINRNDQSNINQSKTTTITGEINERTRIIRAVENTTERQTNTNDLQQQLNERQERSTIQQMIPQYDTTPNRSNEAWGASINNKPSNTFRIYFQNINGLQLRTNKSKYQPHLSYMRETEISISGFAETNTNWNYKNIKKQISAHTKTAYDNYSIAFTNNTFNPPDRSPYLPGGCLQLSTGHWTSRIIEEIKDPRKMGRWTGHKFRLREGKTMSVITAYRPCQQSVSDATQASTTVTYQQKNSTY
jgi:hypothetical protein